MGILTNPIGNDLPVDLQDSLSAIDRKRLLATMLRKQMIEPSQAQSVNGMLLPNFQPITNAILGFAGQKQLDSLDAQEKAAIDKYQKNFAQATGDVVPALDPLSANPATGQDYTPQEISHIVSQAYAAGVPKDLIDKMLTTRGGVAMINNMLGAESPFARGGGGPVAAATNGPPQAPAPAGGMSGGAPPAAMPGGQSMGFLPNPNAPVPAVPGANAAAPVAAVTPVGQNGPGTTPFAKMTDKQLFVLSSLPNPMQGIAKDELEARKVKVDAGTAYDWRGNPLYTVNRNSGMITDYRNVDAKGNPTVSDPLAELSAARAGKVAGAEAAAKLPYETVSVPTSSGRQKTVFKSELPGAPGGAPDTGVPAPGAAMDLAKIVPSSPDEAAQLGSMLAKRGINASYTIGRDGQIGFGPNHGASANGQTPNAGAQGGGAVPTAPKSVSDEMAAAAQALPRQPEVIGTGPTLTAEKFAGANAEAQKGRVEAIANEGAASQENNAYLTDISHHLRNADTSAVAPARQAAAEWLNSMGFDTASPIVQFVAGGNLGALQAINKDSTQLAATATKALGSREAAQIFMQIMKANPNIATTPEGLAKIIDFMQGMNQYKLDRYQGMAPWIQNSPTGDIQGYESAFMAAHPPQSYVAHLRVGATPSASDQSRGSVIENGVATPARGNPGSSRQLTPAEQKEYDALAKRLGMQ